MMRATSTAIVLLLMLGTPFASRAARAQEPPPYQGNDAAPPDDAAPQDNAPQAPEAPADPAVAGVEYFHDQLAPYGQWVEREGYGVVWVPQVQAGWRPYTTGHWVYTDQGWAWVADEPWGWAAFHYGRWYYDPEIGWAWVPGTVWAPAWVAWRHGGGYLGWAPLGPAVGFTFEAGLDFGGFVIAPGFYTFVGERDILAPRVSTVIVSTTRNVTIVNNTTNITNYGVVNGRIVNSGVSADRIAQVTGRPVPRVAVASMARASANGKGAFYQPPVVTRAARSAHAEFGTALPTQVATQQKSRVFAAAATAPRSATAASRSRPTTNAAGSPGSRTNAMGSRSSANAAGPRTTGTTSAAGPRTTGTTSGQRSTRGTGTPVDESHDRGHYGVGIDKTHGRQGSGTGSTGGAGSTGSTGSAGSAGSAGASAGHGQPGSSPNQSHGSQPGAQAGPQGHAGQGATPQRQPAPPPPPKKAPPPEKEKEKKTGV
jgi:hypothetical protein